MSSSAQIDNKKKDILILGKGPTQGLEDTLTAEKMYSINFTVTKKNFFLSLHYNGANSKCSKSIMLRNISKDCSADNMKKTGLNGYVYDFSVDYEATDFDDILEIHTYLMKKNNIV